MKTLALLFIAVIGVFPLFDLPSAEAQSIIVNSTTPCFLNYTAGVDMWRNCGADEDWVGMAILPFEWITGGFFSLILASLIILGVYLKYHKVIYAFAVGIVLLPISSQLMPNEFMSFAVLAVTVGLSVGIIFMIRDQIRG